MPALFLREADVEELLTMELALAAVADVFRKQAMTEVENIPRQRARTDHAMLHLMGAAVKGLGVMGCKVYSTTKGKARFYVQLFDGNTGELVCLLEADRLGAMRTGAASGVATDHLANPDADTVGLFGSGKQAATQLEAVCRVRNIVEAYVYSPNAERCEAFCRRMATHLGITIRPVATPELAAEDKDVIITATSSVNPVLVADWVAEGAHLNVIGTNFIGKAEIDVELVRRCSTIVVDDKHQSRMEAGDLVFAVEQGVIRWSDVVELGDVVVDRHPGRQERGDVTLFKSVGVGLEDVAVAKAVYNEALNMGIGQPLPF